MEPRVCQLGMRNSTGSPIYSDFSESLVFRPLVKRNKDSGYEVGQTMEICFVISPHIVFGFNHITFISLKILKNKKDNVRKPSHMKNKVFLVVFGLLFKFRCLHQYGWKS